MHAHIGEQAERSGFKMGIAFVAVHVCLLAAFAFCIFVYIPWYKSTINWLYPPHTIGPELPTATMQGLICANGARNNWLIVTFIVLPAVALLAAFLFRRFKRNKWDAVAWRWSLIILGLGLSFLVWIGYFGFFRPFREARVIIVEYIHMPSKMPLLSQLIDDPRRDVRLAATIALGYMRDGAAVEPLIKALGDMDPWVRRRAASGLRWSGDMRASEVLIALLDRADEAEEDVAKALGTIGGPGARDALLRALDRGLWSAPAALGELGDSQAIEPLIRVLEENNSGFYRSKAIDALGVLGDRRVVPVLIDALSDQDGFARSAAINALSVFAGQYLGPDASVWREWWQRECERP